MAKILAKGESVYECDACKRRVRVPTNRTGLDVVQRCIITSNCQGKLHKVVIAKDITATPAFPPEVAGVRDWFQRKVLHTHEQTVQSSNWVINHGLANKPNIYVYVTRYVNGVATEVPTREFTTTIVDLNTAEIKFAQAERGQAQCITSASQNATNPIATAGVATAATDVQLSSNGEISVATLDDSIGINLTMTYNSPSSPAPINIQYLNIDDPSVSSPWAGVKNVIIGGRRYTVRSFNIVTTQLAPPYFASGAIIDGSTITVTDTIGTGEVLFLLATSPYAAADRVFDRYVDASSIKSGKELLLNAGELYADQLVIRNTYPPIIVA